MSRPEWIDVLEELCRRGFDPDGPATGGAQVQVFAEGAQGPVYRQPIDRVVRLDDNEPLLWFRQIIGEGPTFDIAECRRRSLSTTGATVEGARVIFPQPDAATGEHAVILAADPDQIPALDTWDVWKGSGTTAEEEAALDSLESD